MDLDSIALAPGETSSTKFNTGNIRASAGGFKSYSNFDEGIQDQQRLLGNYQTEHNLNTVQDIGNRWAPPSENNTSIYVKTLARHLGVKPTDTIDLSDPVTMGKLSYIQAKLEKGANKIPYDEDHFIELARTRTGQQPRKQDVNLDDIAQPPADNEEQGPDDLDSIAQAPEEAPEATQEAPEATQQGNWSGDAGYLQPTARALTGAAVSVANIPAEMADAVSSAGAWLGGKLGIGDGTYKPAPRVSTGDIEQGLGLEAGSLTPQQTSEKVMAGAIPFLVGGEGGAATKAPEAAGFIARNAPKVANALARNLTASAFGSLAQNSDKNDPTALASDLALNTLGGVLFEGTGSAIKQATTGRRAALETLSNDVTRNKAINETHSALVQDVAAKEANVNKTADELTKADIRHSQAIKKGASEEEINKLRGNYLDAEEAHLQAQKEYADSADALNSAVKPDIKQTANIQKLQEGMEKFKQANEGNKHMSAADFIKQNKSLVSQYGLTPKMLDKYSRTKAGKIAGSKAVHTALHALGLTHGIPGVIATGIAHGGIEGLVNRSAKKGLADIGEALQGNYSSGMDIPYTQGLIDTVTSGSNPLLKGYASQFQ